VTTFLHVFALTVGGFSLLGGGVLLWMLGLVKPADALMDRDHMNLATCYIAGYFILTAATVAGVIAAVT
jgi:hypothetical protein